MAPIELDHCVIHVSDWERSNAFYRDVLFNPHWGEQLKFRTDNTLEISMVSQGLDKEQAGKVWQPFIDWVKASPADFVITSPLRSGAWPAPTR